METAEDLKRAAARQALELAGCPRTRLAGRVAVVASRLDVVRGVVIVPGADGQPRRRRCRSGGDRYMTPEELIPELLEADRRGALQGFRWMK